MTVLCIMDFMLIFLHLVIDLDLSPSSVTLMGCPVFPYCLKYWARVESNRPVKENTNIEPYFTMEGVFQVQSSLYFDVVYFRSVFKKGAHSLTAFLFLTLK